MIFDGPVLRLEAGIIGTTATCPACRVRGTRVHSHYVRRPLDLPWRGRLARLVVTVRRFRCDNPECERVTFAEDCGEDLPRYARRTRQASNELLNIAMVAGGEPGSRLAISSGLPASPETLLRLQRSMPLPTFPTPRVLGIDDFSLRRRQTYATIFVDLETRRPIDILEGREADTVEGWLKGRSGIELIVRDRSGAYADGARAGAPQAKQVADRFHLLQNASTALDELLRSHRRQTEYLEISEPPQPASTTEQVSAETSSPAAPPPKLSPTKQRQAERRQARVDRWGQAKEMREAGQSLSQIAKTLGMNRRTVRRYLATPEPVRNQVEHPRPGGLKSPMLQPFVSYLQDRWQAGCHNASELFREIVARGYLGSRTLLAQSIQGWRPPRVPKKERRLRRRTSVRWLVLRPPEQLKPEEKPILQEFLAKNPEISLGYDLVQQFRALIAERSLGALNTWLGAAKASGLSTFVSLANGLEADRAAVERALELPWSNGPVEGQVTRVKLIKRQGYGRAKLDLLRRRVLAA